MCCVLRRIHVPFPFSVNQLVNVPLRALAGILGLHGLAIRRHLFPSSLNLLLKFPFLSTVDIESAYGVRDPRNKYGEGERCCHEDEYKPDK